MNEQFKNPTSERIANRSIFVSTIDLDEDGKHFGHFKIPYSRDDASLGDIMAPLISIKNGDGPCLLLGGGNHGDEFEGQIALRNLAHDLRPEDVSGQVILVPAINLPAVLNNSRCSPLDDKNINRLFPGDQHGTITEKIASFIYDELVQRADYVVDLHAGGRSMHTMCYAQMHRYDDPRKSKATLDLMKAFAVPIGLVYDTEPDVYGNLDTVVEELGTPFIAVELGGSGTVSPQSVAVTMRGVRNVLVHCGIVRGHIDSSEGPTTIMGVPAGGFVTAEDHGIFEPFFDLGDFVEPGQPVGQMHSIQRPDRKPVVHHIREGGQVICRRTIGLTTHGDCLYFVAVPLDPGF